MVWQNKPPGQRMASMQRAAGVRNFLLRVKDVPAVIDQLKLWNKSGGHALAGMLDLSRIGMSGHSLGASTTQAMSGQLFSHGAYSYTDQRIKAAIALSPSSPGRGTDPKEAFGGVNPMDADDRNKRFHGDREWRCKVPAGRVCRTPPGRKYELVLDGAEHSAFTDRAPARETGKRHLDYHQVILALSTAFWTPGCVAIWRPKRGSTAMVRLLFWRRMIAGKESKT